MGIWKWLVLKGQSKIIELHMHHLSHSYDSYVKLRKGKSFTSSDPLNPMESPCFAGELPWKPRFSQTWCPAMRWNYDTALPQIASPQRSKVRAIPGPGPDDPEGSDPLAAYLSVANLVWTGSYGEWPTLYGVFYGCKWSIFGLHWNAPRSKVLRIS